MFTGISTSSLFLRQNTEEAAVTIKNMGAQTAEIFYNTFYEYRPEFSKALAPQIKGLDVNSVHVLTSGFEPLIFNASRRARGDGYYWLDQVMRSAQLLGCKRYTFHGSMRIKKQFNADYDSLAAYLRECIGFCASYGVTLCLENVSWCLYNRPGIFRELKCRVPELYGVFDIKQARRSGYPYPMYIKDMEGAISHVHLSDIDENGKMCLPGQGVYDFIEILSRLKDSDFDGGVIIEAYPEDYGEVSELKNSLEYLNELIYKLSL